MRPDLHNQLLQKTAELRRHLATRESAAVVRSVVVYFLRRTIDPSENEGLGAPAKQLDFLLGLMLTSPEPTNPTHFSESDWKTAVDLLNDIVRIYADMFWPTEEEMSNLTDAWRDARAVAMPAFLHYFTSGVLASSEQVHERIQLEIAPFDSEIASAIGLSASKAMEIADWILDRYADQIGVVSAAVKDEKTARLSLLDQWAAQNWTLPEFRNEADKAGYRAIAERLFSEMDELGSIRRTDLISSFGTEGEAFWRAFTIARGSFEEFKYLTEYNPVEHRPLVLVSDDRALLLSPSAVIMSVLRQCEKIMDASTNRSAYLRARDKALEDQAISAFKQFFNDSLEVYSSVFETPHQQYEHDAVFLWRNTAYVLEAKASPPKEPFRDPDRAFTRIRRGFRSDGGIQKAYEQAERIRSRWAAGETVSLYDGSGALVATIAPNNVKYIFNVCVTRDDFGALAVDLSLLLERRNGAPYPWAVNILDLQNMVECWEYFGWNGREIHEYIEDRIELNGKLICSDELEIVGYRIKHGSLQELNIAQADRVTLNPRYSDVIDEIYRASRGGDPVVYDPQPPYMADMREELRKMFAESSRPEMVSSVRRQGRNEKCACGSGLKYKKCCGKSAV